MATRTEHKIVKSRVGQTSIYIQGEVTAPTFAIIVGDKMVNLTRATALEMINELKHFANYVCGGDTGTASGETVVRQLEDQ